VGYFFARRALSERFSKMASYGETICCDRCGQAIKNIFDFDGKQYGSECIEAVIGFTPKTRDADRAVIVRNAQVANMTSHIAKMDALREANKVYIDACHADVEARGTFDCFAGAMHGLLQSCAFDDLSPKQQTAILKIVKKWN
jgi:hypothetical protein